MGLTTVLPLSMSLGHPLLHRAPLKVVVNIASSSLGSIAISSLASLLDFIQNLDSNPILLENDSKKPCYHSLFRNFYKVSVRVLLAGSHGIPI